MTTGGELRRFWISIWQSILPLALDAAEKASSGKREKRMKSRHYRSQVGVMNLALQAPSPDSTLVLHFRRKDREDSDERVMFMRSTPREGSVSP